MKTPQEIKQKIQEFEKEKQDWKTLQKNYTWNKETKENGSTVFGMYQAREFKCSQQIKLLNWVLNEN